MLDTSSVHVSFVSNFLLGRTRSTPDEIQKSSETAGNTITARVAHRSLAQTLKRYRHLLGTLQRTSMYLIHTACIYLRSSSAVEPSYMIDL